jgi:hypothetical protein
MEVSADQATPADTFDHTLGTGALSYSWWVRSVTNGSPVQPGWEVSLTCEDGNGGTRTAAISHETVLAAARQVLAARPKYASDALVRECGHLLYAADCTDFDAPAADELLQFIVLGEIIFG